MRTLVFTFVLLASAAAPLSAFAQQENGVSPVLDSENVSALHGDTSSIANNPSLPDSSEVERLKDLLEQQARQYEAQRAVNAEQQSRLDRMESEMAMLRGLISSTPSTPSMSTVKAPADDPPTAGAKSDASPLFFRIGKSEFTPGGFLDFTTVFRSKTVGSGIGTSFGTIPYSVPSSYPAAGLSELRMSAQNSRLSLKVDSEIGSAKVYGYVETDFLGNNATTMYVTSNSATFRLRAAFVDVSRGRWEVLAGQDWSLLTPNRKGVSPMTSDVFYSMDGDSNYQMGVIWARQAQFRVAYHLNPSWVVAASAENPQQFIGSALTLPAAFASVQADTNGATWGANTNTPNFIPDFIAKIAYDKKLRGRSLHIDAAGIYRDFRINTFAAASATPQVNANSTASGGGASLNANLEVARNFHLIENAFWSDGGGRYILGLAPDFVVRPANSSRIYTISPVHSGSGLLGFEWQASPKIALYSYYSALYASRDYYSVAANTSCGALGYCGYGFPGSSNATNRNIQEDTVGISRTIWNSPETGKLVFHSQASYLTRRPWFIASGTPKEANLVMVYMAMKYVLP